MRSVLLCLLLSASLLFSNCKKEVTQVTEVTQVVQPNRTILATLQPGNWKFDASSNTYYNEISVPEIDDNVVKTQGVLAYMSFNNVRYEILPDVLNGSTYVCFYQKGLFDVEIQNADGTAVLPPTGAISLKIVLIDSVVQ
jgi:hypothetical protein